MAADRRDCAVKKPLTWVVIAFLVYFLVTQPAGMADVLSTIGSWFADVFQAVIVFFGELF
jgi:hypothetical protein